MKYPAARRSSAADVFHSAKKGPVTVPNPYDWLEDLNSEETQDFVTAQNAAFQKFLTDPKLADSKAHLSSQLRSMHGMTVMTNVPKAVGDDYFFRVAGRGRDFPVTYRCRREVFSALSNGEAPIGVASEPEVFHDEETGGGVLISSGFSASGAYWAYNTSFKGSDWGVVRVRDTQTSESLPDEVHNTKFTTTTGTPITWLGDRGFFYQYWPGGQQQASIPQLRFHFVATSQEADELVYQDSVNPGHTFKASVSLDGSLVFLQIYKAGRTCQVWAARVVPSTGSDGKNTQSLNLRFDMEICNDFDYEWDYVGSMPGNYRPEKGSDQSHLFWTSADNGKVIDFALNGVPAAIVMSASEEQTLKFARLLPNGNILAVWSVDVRDELQIYSLDGRHLRTLDSPMWTILDASFNAVQNKLLILESSFCYPPALWQSEASVAGDSAIAFSQLRRLELFPLSKREAQPLSTRQAFYTSRDGTKVPMFLTSDSSRPVTAQTPVLLYIYGGFGISVIPHFRPEFVAFLRAFNGVLAIANVRGGGEYGHRWYKAALKENRQVLFDDTISAAEYLRSEVGSEVILLMGESMGGLNAGVVMVQRPELLSGVLLNTGALDVLHRRRLGMPVRGSEDIGDPQVPEEFDFTYQWSPLDKVEVGRMYPAVLLTAGDRDDLVPLAHSAKMAATLQHATKDLQDANIISMKIVKDLGHGGNISAAQRAMIGLERWIWVSKALGLQTVPN